MEIDFNALGVHPRPVLTNYVGMLHRELHAFEASTSSQEGIRGLRKIRAILQNTEIALDAVERIIDEKTDYCVRVSHHVHSRADEGEIASMAVLTELGIKTVNMAAREQV